MSNDAQAGFWAIDWSYADKVPMDWPDFISPQGERIGDLEVIEDRLNALEARVSEAEAERDRIIADHTRALAYEDAVQALRQHAEAHSPALSCPCGFIIRDFFDKHPDAERKEVGGV